MRFEIRRASFIGLIGLAFALVACPIVAPTITVQPKSPTVIVGQTPTITVTATGSEPLAYQWQKNGADIAGATSATYTAPAVVLTDTGSLFQVKISNAAGSVSSCIAALTVIASGTPSSGDPICPAPTPPMPPTPPSPPSPPGPPSPPSPPGPPSPPTPPSPPSPPTPPTPPPNTPWRVPVKKWNATFKVTTVDRSTEHKGTRVIQGSAVFENTTPSLYMVSISGSFTVTASFTATSDSFCKLTTENGSGTIGLADGSIYFTPDDTFVPIQVGYWGSGVSAATVTTTYSNCPPPTPSPSTKTRGEGWLFIPTAVPPAIAGFFTSPNLLSFSDQYTVSSDPDVTNTWEWSFTRAN
jgi:hypothetical protein